MDQIARQASTQGGEKGGIEEALIWDEGLSADLELSLKSASRQTQ